MVDHSGQSAHPEQVGSCAHGGRALVIGEAIIDLIARSDERGTCYVPKFGGSPLNVAVGIRRLGTPVFLAATLAPGTFADALERFCVEEGVDISTLSTRVDQGFISVATPLDGRVSYEYYGPLASLTAIEEIDEEYVLAADVLHASSTALMADPARATIRQAFATATGFKAMDPNPRSNLIQDRPAYLAGLETIYPLVDLLKVSDEDLEFLAPGESAAESALALHRRYGVVVIVTRAASPTLLVHSDGITTVDVSPTTVVDATGAGDSFMASLLADVAQYGRPSDRKTWSVYIERANQAASATCRGHGGAESMPTAASLAREAPVCPPD